MTFVTHKPGEAQMVAPEKPQFRFQSPIMTTASRGFWFFTAHCSQIHRGKKMQEAADARLNALAGIPSLPIDAPTFALAEQLVKVCDTNPLSKI